jgi:hypothetical protein
MTAYQRRRKGRGAAGLPGPRGAESTYQKHDTPKPNHGRPEFQGNTGNARNPDQKYPAWREPKGADAAADVERALSGWTAMHGRHPRDPRRRQ